MTTKFAALHKVFIYDNKTATWHKVFIYDNGGRCIETNEDFTYWWETIPQIPLTVWLLIATYFENVLSLFKKKRVVVNDSYPKYI